MNGAVEGTICNFVERPLPYECLNQMSGPCSVNAGLRIDTYASPTGLADMGWTFPRWATTGTASHLAETGSGPPVFAGRNPSKKMSHISPSKIAPVGGGGSDG